MYFMSAPLMSAAVSAGLNVTHLFAGRKSARHWPRHLLPLLLQCRTRPMPHASLGINKWQHKLVHTTHHLPKPRTKQAHTKQARSKQVDKLSMELRRHIRRGKMRRRTRQSKAMCCIALTCPSLSWPYTVVSLPTPRLIARPATPTPAPAAVLQPLQVR